MTKRQYARIQKALEQARARFDAEVKAIANDARSMMLPYFHRRGFTYRAGNGSWLIERPGAPFQVWDTELPDAIRDTLYLEVESGHVLGFWVSDIP